MANRKKSILLIALLLVALLLLNVPVFAQQVFTYIDGNGHIAHVMFTASGVIIEQGGITKNLIPKDGTRN